MGRLSQLIRLHQKPLSSILGAQLSSSTTISPPKPAKSAEDKDIQSTDSEEFLSVNGLAAESASGLERYVEYVKMMSNEEPKYKFVEDECAGIHWPGEPCYEKIKADRISAARGLPTDNAERKRLQLWTYLMDYFPDVFLALVEVSVAGNEQHNPGEPLHWERSKSNDQMNTAFRHQFDYGRGVKKDTDGQWHLAKAIWRLSARLQLDIEEERKNNE